MLLFPDRVQFSVKELMGTHSTQNILPNQNYFISHTNSNSNSHTHTQKKPLRFYLVFRNHICHGTEEESPKALWIPSFLHWHKSWVKDRVCTPVHNADSIYCSWIGSAGQREAKAKHGGVGSTSLFLWLILKIASVFLSGSICQSQAKRSQSNLDSIFSQK